MNWKKCPAGGGTFLPSTRKQKSCSRNCSIGSNAGSKPTKEQREGQNLALAHLLPKKSRDSLPPDPSDLSAAVQEFVRNGGAIVQLETPPDPVGKPLVELVGLAGPSATGAEEKLYASHESRRSPHLYEEVEL